MRNFTVFFGFLFLFLVTSWPNHHCKPLFTHLKSIKHRNTPKNCYFLCLCFLYEHSYSFEDSLQLLGLDESLEGGRSDPIVTRGAYLSLIYLRHLKLRQLQVRRTARHDEARCALGDSGHQRSVPSLFPVHSAFLSGCWTTCALWRGLWPLTWRVWSWRKESCAARRRKQAGWTQPEEEEEEEEEEERREVSARSSSATTLQSTVRWERRFWLVGMSAGNKNTTCYAPLISQRVTKYDFFGWRTVVLQDQK